MRAAVVVLWAMLVASLWGCGAAPKAAVATAGGPAEPCPAPGAMAASRVPPQESLLERVPASAVAAVILRRGALGVPRGLLEHSPAMQRELAAYLTRELGVDPTGIDGLVAWSSNLAVRSGALFVRLQGGAGLKGRRAGQHRGVDLVEVDQMIVAASLDGGLVVGSPTEVAHAIDLNRGQAEPVGASSPLGFMRDAASPDIDIVAGAHLPSVVDPSMRSMVHATGLNAALLTFTRSGLITARVLGDRERLGAVREMFKVGVSLVLASLERNKDESLRQSDVSAAVGAIFAYHQAHLLSQELEPRIDGNSLVSQYRLPQLAASEMYLFYGGIAAAIAIPAFVKYVRRSKAAEARLNLQVIAAGARAFHEQYRKAGRRFAFPATTPWTPAEECCKSGGRCAPDPTAFGHPTWKALHFSVTGSHYYQYRFVSEGKGKQAKFVAEARGDLDCNKVYSTFRLHGHLAADGSLVMKPLEVQGETE